MELLRKRLGMRPTDMRRVVKKAPEVLAPRADGSTAAEAVDVSIHPGCLLYTSPSPRDLSTSRMPSSA